MNFLSHIYLSDDDDLVRIGNFMADSIKGKSYLDYHPKIQSGILLHREIDSFTDSHPVFRQSKHRLHEDFGHYSGVLIDLYYDHFLAKHFEKYHSESLNVFVQKFYLSLNTNFELLTPKIQNMMPYMISQNWLESYKTFDGIETIMIQMDYRTQNKSNMRFGIKNLKSHYLLFEEEFFIFFEAIQTHINQFKNQIK